MSFSLLVPFREAGDGSRERLWRFVRWRLEAELPEAEIVECSDDGLDPFNKSMAVNEAARRASTGTFAIWDADCWCPPEQVRGAVRLVEQDPACWSRPWHRKVKLGAEETERILALGESWDGTWDRKAPVERINTFWASPPLVLDRDLYAEVGGMDERYRGWGGEDIAFARALWKTGHGFATSVHGACLHLYHPRIGAVGRDRWHGQEEFDVNRPLEAEYMRARTPEQMRELIRSREGAA